MRGSPLALLFFLPLFGGCFGAGSLGLGSVGVSVAAVLVLVLSRMVEGSRPSRRAANAASMRWSMGRSLWRLQRSEQYFTSVDEVFADCDFREPGGGVGVSR